MPQSQPTPFLRYVIPDGETFGSSIHLEPNQRLWSFALRGVTSPTLTFQHWSPEDDSWLNVYDDEDAVVSLALANDRFYCVDTNSGKLAQLHNFRIVVGGAQTGEGVIELWMKK
jgi:hypothetical protein